MRKNFYYIMAKNVKISPFWNSTETYKKLTTFLKFRNLRYFRMLYPRIVFYILFINIKNIQEQSTTFC